MFDLNKITRAHIKDIEAYSSARKEYEGDQGIFLDANENPFGQLNRYPDPNQKGLKQVLSKQKGISEEQIFIGNGSDEIIDLAFRIFCTPSEDAALSFSPSFGMYEVSSRFNDVRFIKIPLDEQFNINFQTIKESLENPKLKLVFICSPNNPTGNCLDANEILKILQSFQGIVFIDEAYIDFSNESSWLEKLDQFPNLIVSQTMSKAWGLAAARIGIGYSSKEIIALFNKVKAPYNLSQLNQDAAIKALNDPSSFRQNLNKIKLERSRLTEELMNIKIIKKIYPSQSNFLLVKVDQTTKIYEALCDKRIIIRNRNTLIKDHLRISIGTKSENNALLKALKELS